MASQLNQPAVAAFGYALAVVNLLNAALVVSKESNPALLDAMKAATGHHWITHGVAIVLAFVVLGVLLARIMTRAGAAPAFDRVMAAVIGSTVLSGLAIAAFFLAGG